MADKKFSPMRYSGSTEEAAVEGALQLVGATRDEIEFEVLERTEKGVTVRIKPRSSDAPSPVAAAPVEEAPAEVAPVEEAPVADATAFVEEEVFEAEAFESESFEAETFEADPFEEPSPIVEDIPELLAQAEEEFDSETVLESESEDSLESEPEFVASAPLPLVEQDPEVVERARVQAQEFLDRMGLDATAGPGPTTDVGSVAIVIEGEDVGILIGKHGATLQSFQYLLNLTLNAHHEGEGTRVVVDAGNYRARRQSSLEQTARSAASKARRENRAIRLEPMPAHERRLVHMFLQTEADIATQSEGREPMRRIVVAPASGGRPAAPRSGRSGGERTHSENRSSNNGGMGGYRRGDAQSERNRGLQRGR